MRAAITVLVLLFIFFTNAQPVFTYPSLIIEYDSAFVFRNLKLIPIKRIEPAANADTITSRKKYITLKEGLQKGLITIEERGEYLVDNINVLMIQNRSGKDLFIKSGEIVMGGRQDRVFARDTIIRSSSKPAAVSVYCIEENRWSSHEKKFIYRGNTANGLQKLIDSVNSQTKLWDEIRRLLKQNNQTSTSSYAALINNKKISDTTNAYFQYFLRELRRKDSSIVGVIASTGNKVLGADVFITTSLFYQTLPNILEKFAIEATMSGSPPPSHHEQEKKYADEMLSPSTQNDFLTKKGKRFFYKGVLIQITGY
jgi:hypothetical protein